ncbi:hypothetical protein P7K49_030216 [Saguinus oedipus]|uniref:Uncharacterized protein n=1 Tax=Saguinus oedipus TaxID=9490 RepID=A0ABQ9U1J8_SAGOE|nr:hypothetical protein P7K49_030216 [Saguinus oedipus]
MAKPAGFVLPQGSYGLRAVGSPGNAESGGNHDGLCLQISHELTPWDYQCHHGLKGPGLYQMPYLQDIELPGAEEEENEEAPSMGSTAIFQLPTVSWHPLDAQYCLPMVTVRTRQIKGSMGFTTRSTLSSNYWSIGSGRMPSYDAWPVSSTASVYAGAGALVPASP